MTSSKHAKHQTKKAIRHALGDADADAALAEHQHVKETLARLDALVDVVIEGGRITRLARGAATPDVLAASGAVVVDGSGLWALPAFVDLHAHLREPGQEYKEDVASGLAAAAAGETSRMPGASLRRRSKPAIGGQTGRSDA